MKYLGKKFSSPANSAAFVDNWDAVFGGDEPLYGTDVDVEEYYLAKEKAQDSVSHPEPLRRECDCGPRCCDCRF